jgi:poly [ADP-ribose] polymerase 6/8
VSLPDQLKLKWLENYHQFMAILSAEEAEQEFQQLKQQYGSFYLWHGSAGPRWHSILRTGLKNCTGTGKQANGARLGPGIYLARQAQTSEKYILAEPVKYRNSSLGGNLAMIALCEIASIPDSSKGYLKDHGGAHTLTYEAACVVRFLILDANFQWDSIAYPPPNVPTLRDVLEFHSSAGTTIT